MHKQLHVEIVTPEGPIYTGEVDGLVAPGINGYFGLLPNHAPLIAELGIGDLRLRQGTEWQHYAVAGGMLHIRDGKVTIIGDAVERAADIDIERAEQAAERARERLARRLELEVDPVRAEIALVRALNRLKVAGRP
ncbi:MAG: F0F1 ATP synthase subunit epsilon [Armatimonadia bacterium]